MENICNSYRNIVERAIFAGVINEEHRDLYLSAIDDENSSYMSEVENKQDEKETLNRNPPLKHRKDCNNTFICRRTDENYANVLLNTQTKQRLDNRGIETQLSIDSIENKSVLDFKHALENEDTTVDENESDSPKDERGDKSSSNESRNAVCKTAKLMKKPRKNQIISFGVPVYRNIRHLNPFIEDFIKYGASETCFCHPDKNSRGPQSQESNQGDIKYEQLNFENDKNILSRKLEKHLKPNEFCSNAPENGGKAYEDVDYSVKQKSILVCSENKNSCRALKPCPSPVIKNESHMPLCCHKKHRTCSIRRLKIYDDTTNDKTYHNVKQKQSFNSMNQQTFDAKRDTKSSFRTSQRLDQQSLRSNVVKSQNLHDSTCDFDSVNMPSEKQPPSLDSRLKRSQNKDSDAFWNVKVVCHLHLVDKMGGNQDPDDGIDERETKEEILKPKNNTQSTMESNNGKDSKKTHLFSKMLSTMKINRKLKKS